MGSIGANSPERELQEWMAALDVLEYPIFMHDKAFRVLRCNRAYEQYAGLPVDQIIGRPYFEVFPATHAPLQHCLKALEKPVQKGEEEEIEVDGSFFHSYSHAVLDKEGNYLYSIHILKDITEYRYNENKLRDNEAFIKAIMEHLPVGIAVNTVEPSVAFSYMNDTFPRIYRTTREALKNTDVFWEAVYQDPVFREQIRKQVLEDCASADESRMQWKDIPITREGEETTYITAQNIPMPDHNSMISMVWDVTERKEAETKLRASEEKHRAIFEGALDGIVLANAKTKQIVDANRAFCEMLGYTYDELTGLNVKDLHPAKELPHVIEVFEKQAKGELRLAAEMPVKRKDGSRFYADISTATLNIDATPHLVGFFRDTTDRRRAAEALKESEGRFKAIYEKAHDGILLADMDTKKFTAGNARICNMLGYRPEELPSLGVEDIHPAAALPYVLEQFEKQARGEIEIAAGLPVKRRDGTVFYADINSFPIFISGKKYLAGFFRDITEQKEAQQQLQRERDFSERLVETAQVIILVIDPQGRIVRFNPYLEKLSGYSLQEVKGKEWFETFIPEQNRKATRALFLGAINDIQTRGNVDAILTKNGELRQIEWYDKTLKYADGKTMGLLAIGMDITDRRKAEEHLKLFRTLLDRSGDAIEVIEPQTMRLLDVNETECRELGYSREALLTMTVYDIDPYFTPERAKESEKNIRKSGSASFEGVHRRRDGSTFPVEVNAALVELDKPYILSIARNITERRKSEEALKDEAARRRTLMECSRDGIAVFDREHRIVDANARFAEMLGYTPEEVLKLHSWDFVAEMSEEEIRSAFADMANINATIESRHRRKDGTEYEAEVSVSGTMVGGEPMLFTISRDITERKRADETLRRTDRALRTLSAANLVLVRATNELDLLKGATKVIVEKGGYSLAVVYYAENDPEKSMTPKAWSGFKGRKYWMQNLSWRETEVWPGAEAIRSGKTQLCRNIANESCTLSWKEAALAHGYVSNIAFPLSEGGRTFGALSIYSSETELFDQEEVKLLEELAGDLAYGILNLHTRAAHELHAALLRQGMEQSIQAIAATVESRDPYTAGHQKRVAELATAIAHEMGLDREQTEGVRFAAIIHDLGKIHIPAEILSKPGKLSDLEYKLIQEHPKDGYEILKDVKFPWPVAQIILQHHERLDGSGYPQGLKEAEILPEARIIAVADVVEAMSSHRPYRSALGLEPALQEIRLGRGTLYDPGVVDACLRLFADGKFAFSSEGAK